MPHAYYMSTGRGPAESGQPKALHHLMPLSCQVQPTLQAAATSALALQKTNPAGEAGVAAGGLRDKIQQGACGVSRLQEQPYNVMRPWTWETEILQRSGLSFRFASWVAEDNERAVPSVRLTWVDCVPCSEIFFPIAEWAVEGKQQKTARLTREDWATDTLAKYLWKPEALNEIGLGVELCCGLGVEFCFGLQPHREAPSATPARCAPSSPQPAASRYECRLSIFHSWRAPAWP